LHYVTANYLNLRDAYSQILHFIVMFAF